MKLKMNLGLILVMALFLQVGCEGENLVPSPSGNNNQNPPPNGGNNNPPPQLSFCESNTVTEAELLESLQLASGTAFFAGEEVQVNWSFDLGGDNAQVEVAKSDDQGETALSTDLFGTETFSAQGSGDVRASVNLCGVTANETVPVSVREWEESPLSGVAFLKEDLSKVLWAGGLDGSLKKSEDGGETWSVVAGSRKSRSNGALDTTPLGAVAVLKGGVCDGSVFLGTDGGFLYRSIDGGKTSKSLSNGNLPLAYFTTNPQDALKNPSAIRFIIQDPTNSKRIYIGHQAGLTRLNACDASSATAFQNISAFSNQDVKAGVVHQDEIYIGNEEGLFVSADGQNWEAVADVDGAVQWIHPAGANLLVGTAEDVFQLQGEVVSKVLEEASLDGLSTQGRLFVGQEEGVSILRDGEESLSLFIGVEAPVVQLLQSNKVHRLWSVTDAGDVSFVELPARKRPVHHHFNNRFSKLFK